MTASPVLSEHSSDELADDGYTVEQLKEDADAEATAFKTSMELKLERLAELASQTFSVDIQPGTPDSDELRRLSEVREEILHNRNTTLRLREVLHRQVHDFDAYRNTLPASKPYIRGPISKRFNQYMAAFQLTERREEALTHADQLGLLLTTCRLNLETLETQVRLAQVTAAAPPAADAAPAADAVNGVDGATAAPTPAAEAAATERRRKTEELARATTGHLRTKDTDTSGRPAHDAAKDFGDSSSSHDHRAPPYGRSGGTPPATQSDRVRHPSPQRAGGTPPPSGARASGSVFGPLRSDITVSSSSPSRATSTPLAFTAVGDSLLPTRDTGSDFSLYGSNPFYVNSEVKLPIPVDITYTPTKQPLISQTQLQPLPPPTFNGNFLYWIRFRDAFIRLVHAPGRYISDADRLQYLIQALRGEALAMTAGYNLSHGDGNYHHVTAALEEEFYRPFQACKVLHHEFLQLKPANNTPEALRRFADATIQCVNLLRDYNHDIIRDRIAVENWMEKIPNQTRLEMCRTIDPSPSLSLEEAVQTLKRVVRWQTNAAIFSSTCGLGSAQLRSSGTPRAITSGHSSGPIITEVKEDDRTGGFFGTPKAYPSRFEPACCLCGKSGDHWPSRCPAYNTAKKRFARARQLEFCTMCLRKAHRAGDQSCRAKHELCRFCCANFHHKALCQEYQDGYQKRIKTQRKKSRQHPQALERSPGGKKSSQPVRAGARPPQGEGPRTGRPAATAYGSGPGAGRRADGSGSTAVRYAQKRPGLATHAATTSLEESTDGSTKPSTETMAVPDASSGHRTAEPQTQDVSSHWKKEAHQSLENSEDTELDHISDAPTEPDTDEEDTYDDTEGDDRLDGVGTFGAAVPSGTELCRTHLLECVKAEVFNPTDHTRSKTATVFFDCGSSQTFVSKDTAADLGLINLGRREMTLDTFANDTPIKLDIYRTQLGLVTTSRDRIVLDAAASPKVVRQLRTAFITPEDVRELRRNHCDLIPEYVAPDIVIGRDTQHLFRKKDLLPVLPSGFCLVQSTLGTMVAGLGTVPKITGGTPSAYVGTPSSSSSNAPSGNSLEVGPTSLGSFFATTAGDEDSALEKMAENFWKTENIGIEPNTQTPDDQLAHERFKQTTTIDDEGRYQCRLPWNTADGLPPSNLVLPTNISVARGRLTSFHRAHLHEPEFLLKYGEGFTTMERDEVIEKFDPTERNSALLHLLAHHAVLKESSATTKVRPVFDGSAKLPGKPAINDLLHRGPVLLPKMASILIRTRLSQLLLIADIAKAFLQVSLHPDDRSACAFMWLKDPLKPPTDDNIIYYRFRRVTFGLKPSPFLLGATIEMHLAKIGTPLAKEIWSSCYVDNVILGADTLDEALEKYRLSKEYFASAQMQLRQFASNCSQFNASLPSEDAAELRHLMNLGYEWDVASDCWRISLAAKPAKGKPKGRKRRKSVSFDVLTKRHMLQRVARIFDPIGYLQPVLLLAKLAIQEAWKVDPHWDDDPVPATLSELWEEAIKDFDATTIEIPRRISSKKLDWLEVHIYVDASKEAYGFATYLRVPEDGFYSTSLVFSRAKVKPLKDVEKMTIPRMELMAFLLGARQAKFMAETLELSRPRRTIIWSDSMIVLQQIRTPDKSKEVFVENRLAEIRTLQAELRFETRYVNTTENPADLVSRGLPAAELATCDLWWHASPFLLLDEAEWPAQPNLVATPSDATETLLNDASAKSFTADSTTEPDGTPSGTVVSVWESVQEGTPSSATPVGCCGSFRFYTILQRWRYERTERLLAASALSNPLDHTDREASPTDLAIPGFVSFFNAAAREPNSAREPTAILYTDPPAKPDGPTPKWLQIRMLNVTWSKVQRIYFYVLRAVGAFLRLRKLATSSRTPLGIDFSQHFTTKCSHALTDGTPSVHAFCGERLYTASDMQIAATAAIWQAQKAHPPCKATRKQLQLVEFHGILYVKGRLDRSSLATTTITPLYLPRQSVLTDLIIYDYHRANLHAGVTTTLANVRVRYWFAHGRRTVHNAIKRRCFECRKMTNPAYSIPPWSALPTARTEISRPFKKIGVDFYGPVLLKPMNLDGTPSKELRKYYVCLFTCLYVRAVHCELMADLSTAQFFHAFKRFAARRSYPSEVLSDNGATFLAARQTIASIHRVRQRTHAPAANLSPTHKSDADPAASSFALASRTRKGAQRGCKRSAAGTPAAPHQPRGNSLVTELAVSNENLDAEEELFHFFTSNNITWRTITERAAWKGGVYERMIGLIKSCLSKTLGRTRPSVDNYLTLLAQAEWVVNCRPISYINNSERDFTLVRPIDLLIPTLQGQQPIDFMDPDDEAGSKEDPDYVPATAGDKFQRRLLKDLELARRLSDQFGKLWKEGYLLELSRQFGKKPLESSRVPAVGDIVLIFDENLSRAYWRYGLVMELHPSSDGVIREASVRLSETLRDTRRAVTHLFPLKAMLHDPTPTSTCPNIPLDAAEPLPVLMANFYFSEQPEDQEMPPPSDKPTTNDPMDTSEAEVVPTRSRPPTPDKPSQNTPRQRSRSRSKGPREPRGTPRDSQARGTPRASRGPRTPSDSPSKPPQIVNDRPQRSASQEAKAQKQYGTLNPTTIKKQLKGRVIINNDDWPEDGDCRGLSATAETAARTAREATRAARQHVPVPSPTPSRESSASPQRQVRSQIVVPQKNTTQRQDDSPPPPKLRSQIVVPTPKAPPPSSTKRRAAIIPGRGRTDLVPASVALRKPLTPLARFMRQPKSHKLVQVRHKSKARGTPRAEPMETSESATTAQSDTSQSQRSTSTRPSNKPHSKQAGATATASSSSTQTRTDRSLAVRGCFGLIGGNTPATSKQFRESGMDKVLQLGAKKRIIQPPSQVIPFVDTNVRKDMLTYTNRTAGRNRELPVTFQWHAEVPEEYMFAFAVAHFSHPASQVPLQMLPATPTERVPTIEECAADNISYDNGYIRGAIYGCYPHLAFFTNLDVRHYIKQHIFQNKDFRSVGILTGLDYNTPVIDHPWNSTDEMILDQIAAYTDFVSHAIDLHKQGIYRPLCLILVPKKKHPRNAVSEGLQILRTLDLPRAYPIYLVTWEGTPDQAWEWLRHFPRTKFGITCDYIRRRTDPANLLFKRELPLEHFFLESVTPQPNNNGAYRTSEDVLFLSELMQAQVGEDHRHILAVTAIAAHNFFFPNEIPPTSWFVPPSKQITMRMPNVQTKLAIIAARKAAATAAAGKSVAPGGPSARKQKGTTQQSAKALEKAWNQVDDGSFADFIKEKMDEFSPHYTTTQEQEIMRERRVAATNASLYVTVVSTELRVDLRGDQRTVFQQAATSSGAPAAAGTSGQSSAAATAAAAPATEPETPDHSARAAAEAEPLPLDRHPWSVQGVALPSSIQPPLNTNQVGFNSPRTNDNGDIIYSGFEPLIACPGHGRTAQHMTLEQALKDYKRICRNVSAERRADGTRPIHSFGEMFCAVWAQRFAHFPRADGTPSASTSSAGAQGEPPRQPNLAVHDFLNALLRHEPSAIPQTMNRYFRLVTQNTHQPPFSPGDLATAILRWFESCPAASVYLRTHLTGPVRFASEFLEGCDPEIANAFAQVMQEGFSQALDYVRLRVYMVVVRRHPMWTTPQQARNLKKSELRHIKVDQDQVLQHRQIVLTDVWGDNFMSNLRPDVHVRQLSGLATEALEVARNYYLGHSVERIYLFWGRDDLLYGPGQSSDRLFSLSHHFAHEFPYVQCFLILPPYLQDKHESYRANIQRILNAQEGSFANVTIVWFPTDEQLSDYFEAARLRNQRPDWPTVLQTSDGTPSEEGALLRKIFWEQRYDVTLWLSAYSHRGEVQQDEADSSGATHQLGQQHQPLPPPSQGQPPNAEDDSSAMDHEPANQEAADTEGTPSVAAIPLPAQEPPRMRSSTADSSDVQILERDDSPGVLSNFSVASAPEHSADVVPLFQHLLNIRSLQPDLQPQLNEQTLALLFPQAGPELLAKFWGDYQKLKLNFYDVHQPAAAPQAQPSESQYDAIDEDVELSVSREPGFYEAARRQRLQELLYSGEDQELDDEEPEADAPRTEGNSSQSGDEPDAQSTEARNSESQSTADETTEDATGRSTHSTTDPYSQEGPVGSDDW